MALAAVALLVALSSGLACAQVCPAPCICRNRFVLCRIMPFDFTAVPGDIPQDTIRLDLSHHAITGIGDHDFSSLTQLRSLYLNNNAIRSISRNAFSGLEQLEYLDLSSNDLQRLPDRVFSPLRNLKTLYLHNNDISKLTIETFYGLSELQRLSLSANQLRILPKEVTHAVEKLVTLEADDNNFHCDCGVAWMQDYDPLHHVLSQPVTCKSPPRLEGRRVDDLTMEDMNCVGPRVDASDLQVEGHLGQAVLLSCDVEGEPVPDIRWLFLGEVIEETDQRYHLLPNGTLLISSLEAGLDGDYTCVATNLAGSSNATVSVSVLLPGASQPVLLHAPSDTHAFIGENVSLSCVGDSHVLSYRWLRGAQELSASSHILVEPGVGLHITNVSVEDAGIYTCIGTGELGNTSANATLRVTGPLFTCEGVIDSDTIQSIRAKVDFAFNQSMTSRNTSLSPMQLLRRLKIPDSGVVELLKAADVFQEALEAARLTHSGETTTAIPMLSACEVVLLAELSGCTQHTAGPDCSDVCFHTKYRSIDGTCNNWDHPTWGSVDTPFVRLLDPLYQDGLGLPVGWSGGLPSARLVSQSVIRAHSVQANDQYTHMLMQIGQFLDHDLDLAPITPSDISFSSGAMCDSTCTNTAPCFPISVPEDDPRISKECLPFTRSSGVCGTGSPSLLVGNSAVRREQINAITSHIDGSQIYGSSKELAERLRDPERPGWLRQGEESTGGKHFLAFDNYSLLECETGVHSNRSACFLAGDVRANEQVGLTTMHTLFFREHNRVATTLSEFNPGWSQERVYQETRRVVVAEWQHIVYNEYLPKILGPAGMAMMGDYSGYNPNVDPTIANVFATAAYRFGHSQIMPLFQRLDANYQPLPIGPLLLQHAFFAPFRLLEEGGVDPILRGLISTPVKQRSSTAGLNSNLTEALFAQAHEVALDLAALNIQRGRDHGLPPYHSWRQYCDLKTDDILEDIADAGVRDTLSAVYQNISAIDLWVGGLLEGLVEGSQLGPTFLCIIADQFRRLRDGDRFWYERIGQFTPDQLQQLHQSSLARVICDNADAIEFVPKDVFVLEPVSDFPHCTDIPAVDLSLWTDCEGVCQSDTREKRLVLFSDVANDVQQLKERIAELENKVYRCVFNGVTYEDASEWNLDKCRHCRCQNGQIVCSSSC